MHWTYSRLSDYEKCPALYAGRYKAKWPGFKPAQHPAAERGEKIHGLMEQTVKGGKKLTGALDRYNPYIADLLKTYPHIETELPLGFDAQWHPTEWRSATLWLRAKMDFFGMKKTVAKVVDWKTGGIYGNNADQVRLYAGMTFERFPSVKKVEVELMYLDQRQGISEEIARADWPDKREEFTRRATAMLTATTFPLKPGAYCGHCAFSVEKGGPCPGRSADRSGLQTESTRARVVAPQAVPLRGRHTGSDSLAALALIQPAGGVQKARRKS